MSKKKILIDFFSSNPLTNVLEYKSLEPDFIYLLINEKDPGNIRAEHLRETVISWGRKVTFSITRIKEHRLSEIEEIIKEIIENELRFDNTIYIDLTGGDALMIAAGFRVSEQYERSRVIPVILDPKSRSLTSVIDERNICSLKDLSLDDYFMARGAKRFKNDTYRPLKKDHEDIIALGEHIFRMPKEWNKLNRMINHTAVNDSLDFELPDSISVNGENISFSDSMQFLTDKFKEAGFISSLGNRRYRFRDKHVRSYMSKYGNWLEMYIFIKALEIFDDAYLSVEIDWDSADIDHTDNEIDVIAISNSVPVFISCKMRDISNYDVYEIGHIADRLNARAVIATTSVIDPSSSKGKSLYSKLKSMDVGLITTEDLLDPTQDNEKLFKQPYII